MVKKTDSAAAKKSTSRKAVVKKTTTKAKTSAVAAVRKVKRVAKPSVSNKVDYYPNRMTVAVSALAGTILVLISVIAVLGSRG